MYIRDPGKTRVTEENKMSFEFEVEVSEREDAGTITAMEMLDVLIRHQVTRINSCGSVWEMTNNETGEVVSTTSPWDESQFAPEQWTARHTNRWNFDVN